MEFFKAMVSEFETGKRRITAPMSRRLAKALHIKHEWLIMVDVGNISGHRKQ